VHRALKYFLFEELVSNVIASSHLSYILIEKSKHPKVQ
jgi:hypothetical protein